MLVQQILFTHASVFFLQTIYPEYPFRMHSVGENIIRINVVLSAYQLIKYNLKINLLDYCSFGLSLYVILCIDQSRIYLLSVLLGIAVIALMNYKHLNLINKLIWVLLFIIGLCLISRNYINSIVGTLNNSKDGSNFARKGAIEYFSNLIEEKKYFGIGYIVPSVNDSFFSYFKGPYGYYNFTDLGILGIYFSMLLLLLL